MTGQEREERIEERLSGMVCDAIDGVSWMPPSEEEIVEMREYAASQIDLEIAIEQMLSDKAIEQGRVAHG